MASARRTGTNESISTYGGGTRNYTSLATWEDATDVNMVTGTISYVLECYNDASSYNDYVTLAGGTTNSFYFRIIRPAAGSGTNGANWHGGVPTAGIRFFSTTDAHVLNNTEANSQIQDVVAKLTINSANNRYCAAASAANAAVVGVLAVDSTNAGAGVANGILVSAGTGAIAVDCLAHNNDTYGIVLFAPAGGTIYAYNCTAHGNAVENWRFTIGNGRTGIVKNCIGSTTGTCFADGGITGTLTMTYCASSDDTADNWGGAGNRINQTFTFVNSGADDFHLASTDAGAKDFGTSLSADAVYAFDDDIDKDTRSGSWDIGFDEYIVPPTTLPPTTLAPTTIAPTTIPTTAPPTTAAPTTLAPTTLAPTSPPTTEAPTTLPPTTLPPTTLAPTPPPTTLAPTTPAPIVIVQDVEVNFASTAPPTTLAPTPAPTTLAPTPGPTTLAPTTIPTTVAPTVGPTTEAPTEAPTTIHHTTHAPTTLPPTVSPTTINPTTIVPTSPPTTTIPTTLAPTTLPPVFICEKYLVSHITSTLYARSTINKEMALISHIIKEIFLHGNLCR